MIISIVCYGHNIGSKILHSWNNLQVILVPLLVYFAYRRFFRGEGMYSVMCLFLEFRVKRTYTVYDSLDSTGTHNIITKNVLSCLLQKDGSKKSGSKSAGATPPSSTITSPGTSQGGEAAHAFTHCYPFV